MATGVGVPTVSGFMSSVGDYAYGLAGGAIYSLVSRYTGSGLIGGGVAAALAGTIVRGTRGEVIATIAGFAAGGELLGLVGLNGGGGGDSGPPTLNPIA